MDCASKDSNSCLMHQSDPEAQEGGFLLERTEGIGLVLLGLGDIHKLNALAA